MKECENCFVEYPKKELIYLETIMQEICEDCFDKLKSEMEDKQE